MAEIEEFQEQVGAWYLEWHPLHVRDGISNYMHMISQWSYCFLFEGMGEPVQIFAARLLGVNELPHEECLLLLNPVSIIVEPSKVEMVVRKMNLTPMLCLLLVGYRESFTFYWATN
jgi:hypothetical protein